MSIETKLIENENGIFLEFRDQKGGTARICTRNHGKPNDGFIEVFGYRESPSGRAMSQVYCLNGLSHSNLLDLYAAVSKMLTFNVKQRLAID